MCEMVLVGGCEVASQAGGSVASDHAEPVALKTHRGQAFSLMNKLGATEAEECHGRPLTQSALKRVTFVSYHNHSGEVDNGAA